MNETREPRRAAGTRADPEAAFGAAEAAALPQVQPREPAPGAAERSSAGAVIASTLVATLVVSGVLEYAGWGILFASAADAAAGIPAGDFVRGTLVTASGALGLGLVGALAMFVRPAAWKRPWKNLAIGFAMGAAAFLALISLVTVRFVL